MKEKTAFIIGLFMFIVIAIVCLMSNVVMFRMIEKINIETEDMKRCEGQNQLLWQFVGDLDQQKDLQDAIAARDILYEDICEL